MPSVEIIRRRGYNALPVSNLMILGVLNYFPSMTHHARLLSLQTRLPQRRANSLSPVPLCSTSRCVSS